MRKSAFLFLLVLSSRGLLADGDSARERFQKQLQKCYDYLPANVPQSVRDEKVHEMDAFWAFVASDLDTYMPLLREALRDEHQNRYFYFDGAGLLIQHSHAKADYELAVKACARCRLKDVGCKGYFYFTHVMSEKGVDAYPLVEKMFGDPKFRFYLVVHAMWLKQRDAVLLCLACMPEKVWVPHLAAQLQTEKDPTAQRSIVFSLAYADTAAADAALAAFLHRKDRPADVAAYAKHLLDSREPRSALPARKLAAGRAQAESFLAASAEKGRVPYESEALQTDVLYLVKKSDVARIREARRKVAHRVSDEGLYDLEYLTRLLHSAKTAP